ncbi:MAG: ABC transporter permease [Vicinamibacterales bacterium]
MIRFLLVSAQIAVRALNRNRFRTVLTMLGVVIGVAAVIAMVALGTGARGSVETSLKSAGTNIIQVSAGNFTRNGESMNIASGLGAASTLTVEDAEAMRQIPGVQHVASGVRNRAWVASAHRKFFTQVRGVEPSLADIHGWTWLRGEFADAPDAAVMGRAASRELFGEGFDPVGEKITIGDHTFTVSGYFRIGDSDQDETVFVPLAAGQAMLAGIRHLHTITVAVGQAGEATRVAMAITDLLRERHSRGRQATSAGGLGGNQQPGGGMAAADDFTVKTQAAANVTKGLYTSVAAFALANMPKLDEVTLQEMSSTLSRAGSTMTALLGSIAAISLIVGGIGIMNIMLVSVTERTKEIGIRLAVGARRRDVLLQFLVEAMVMSLIGGVLGVVIGLATAEGLTAVLDWPTEVSFYTVASAFAIAALVGIVFGYYPARRASRLDPIDSLRYE